MTSRTTLIYLSCVAFGVSLTAALPIIGRFFPGIGKGGLICLVIISVLGISLAPIEFRWFAVLAVVACWVTFVLSAVSGGF